MVTERQTTPSKNTSHALHAAPAGIAMGAVPHEMKAPAKRTLLKKTFEVGSATMLSRLLGMVRVFLQARYLGVGVLSDAFIAAFSIPNRLRKVFAEGALSAAIIPTMVNVVRDDGREQASRVMTRSVVIFEGVLIILCILIFFAAPLVLKFVCPGFTAEHMMYAVPYLRILVALIVFLSSSALLTGALQAVNHFLVPAFGPVLLNVVYIAGLVVGIWLQLPVEMLCYAILIGGCAQFLMHVMMYWKLGFTFKSSDARTREYFWDILVRFFPVLLGMSIMEINLSIDTAFASFLPAGSFTIIEYASRFMGIPLGVFGVAFATIMLPHFSQVIKQTPERLGFYVREAALLIFWVMMSVALVMCFFADKFFITLFVSQKFSLVHAQVSASVLIAFLAGLFFFAFNKILLNVYYALGANAIPTFVSCVAIMVNIGFDTLGVYWLGVPGLALATTLSSAVQTLLFVYFLHTRFNIDLNFGLLSAAFMRMTAQILIIIGAAWYVHHWIGMLFVYMFPATMCRMLFDTVCFWLWTVPLFGLAAYVLLVTRKLFGISHYFIDE